MSRARLTRKNSFFPPALRFVRNSRPAQSALTEKRGFWWRELNFIWVQRHAAARLTRKNSFFPPTLRSVRNSRPAQGALTEKRGFRWREITRR